MSPALGCSTGLELRRIYLAMVREVLNLRHEEFSARAGPELESVREALCFSRKCRDSAFQELCKHLDEHQCGVLEKSLKDAANL